MFLVVVFVLTIFEFFLNVFTEVNEFSDNKIFVITVKGLKPGEGVGVCIRGVRMSAPAPA